MTANFNEQPSQDQVELSQRVAMLESMIIKTQQTYQAPSPTQHHYPGHAHFPYGQHANMYVHPPVSPTCIPQTHSHFNYPLNANGWNY